MCVLFAFVLRLHLHNLSLEEETGADHPPHGPIRYVSKFGFDTTTCCGMIPMPCDWCMDWVVSASQLLWLRSRASHEEGTELLCYKLVELALAFKLTV